MNSLYVTLCLIGAILAVWCMQLSGRGDLVPDEKLCLRWIRRIGYAATSIGLLWSTRFGLMQEWEPWPPYILIVFGLDLILSASIISALIKKRANNTRVHKISGWLLQR